MQSYFDSSGDLYSRGRPTYPAELYYWLANQVASTGRVWDSACGTGQASIDLAAYFDEVEASDSSESQIAEATPHRKVHYQVLRSEQTTYPDHSFDAICVAQALHWFNLEQFWPEVNRLLKPGGLFVCWGYNWLQVSPEVNEVLDRYVMDKVRSHWPAQNRILWDEYRDITFPFDMLDVPEFDLSFKWTAHRLFDYIRSWSATRSLIEDESDAFLQSAWLALQDVWPEPEQKREVSLPFFVKAGRVPK